MRNKSIKWMVGFVITILALAFFVGACVGQATFQPQVIIEHQSHTIYKTVEKVIYEPVEKIIVEHVETPKQLCHFQNLDELEQWLKDTHVIAFSAQIVDSKTGRGIKEPDCDDYALNLQQKALADGYIISFEIIQPSEYNALFKLSQLPSGTFHAINSVVIGNDVYYIEPQTDEVVLAARLD